MTEQPRDVDFESMPTYVLHWRRFVRLPDGQIARVCAVPGCAEHPPILPKLRGAD
jgi:hypothetical protein